MDIHSISVHYENRKPPVKTFDILYSATYPRV